MTKYLRLIIVIYLVGNSVGLHGMRYFRSSGGSAPSQACDSLQILKNLEQCLEPLLEQSSIIEGYVASLEKDIDILSKEDPFNRRDNKPNLGSIAWVEHQIKGIENSMKDSQHQPNKTVDGLNTKKEKLKKKMLWLKGQAGVQKPADMLANDKSLPEMKAALQAIAANKPALKDQIERIQSEIDTVVAKIDKALETLRPPAVTLPQPKPLGWVDWTKQKLGYGSNPPPVAPAGEEEY